MKKVKDFVDATPTPIAYKDKKTWVAFNVDHKGNQIGDCQYGPTKKLALLYLTMENGQYNYMKRTK